MLKLLECIADEGYLERETGVEPATSSLARKHSTTELLPPCLCKYSRGACAGSTRTLVVSEIGCVCVESCSVAFGIRLARVGRERRQEQRP